VFIIQTAGDINGNYTISLTGGNLELVAAAGNIDTSAVGGLISGATNIRLSAAGDIVSGAGGTGFVGSGMLTYEGTGSARFTAGTATFDMPLTVNMPTVINGGAVDFNSPATLAQGVALSAGALSGSGAVTLSGASSWTGGTISGSGSLTIAPGASLGTAGTLATAKPFVNLGAISVNSGTLQLDSFPSNAGSVVIAQGATLSTGNNDLVNLPGGTISGSGTLALVPTILVPGQPAGKALTNQGTLSAGSSPGTLTIQGDLVLTSSSMINIDIQSPGATPGIDFDVIDVKGEVRGTGTGDWGRVTINLGTYTPDLGAGFAVLTAGAMATSGQFAAGPPIVRALRLQEMSVEIDGASRKITIVAGQSPLASIILTPVVAAVQQTVQQANDIADVSKNVTETTAAKTAPVTEEEKSGKDGKKADPKPPSCS
jgi:hypothetical protein